MGTCACYLYIRRGEKIVRIRPPDRNDDGARRARKKGYDPQLRNETCGQVFLSGVQDACGRR